MALRRFEVSAGRRCLIGRSSFLSVMSEATGSRAGGAARASKGVQPITSIRLTTSVKMPTQPPSVATLCMNGDMGT